MSKTGTLTRPVYGTTWVGETYYRQNPEKAEELRGSVDPVGDMARKGSFAFMLFSVISLAGSVFLPWVVKTPSSDEPPSPTVITSRQAPRGKRHKLMITTAWGLSQMAFSGAMILAPLSRSFSFSTILLAFCGLQVYPY